MRYFLLAAALFTTVSVHSQCIGMSGTYTIGGASPDYTSVSAAALALYNNGVCGPVEFEIRNGIYNEQVVIYGFPGASATNTVTFQSEMGDSSLVTIEYGNTSTNNYVVKLSGCEYVMFREIGMHNTNPNNSMVLYAENSRCITVSHCKLWAPVQGSATSSVVYASGCDSVNVLNNQMTGSRNGYNPVNSHHQIVSGNAIINQYRFALNVTMNGSLTFSNNTISTTSPITTYVSLNITNAGDTLSICGNRIVTPTSAISITNSVGTTTHPIRFYNNMISSASDQNCVTLGNGCAEISFCHNSLNYSGDGFALYITSSVNVRLLNNVLSSTGTGAIFRLSSVNTAVIDYNVLHAANDTIAQVNTSNPYFPDFQLWQSGYGRDLNSVMATPQFASSTDLHLLADCSQNMMCNPIDTISTDADGNSRDPVHPYPGADELNNSGFNNDAGTMFLRFNASIACNGSAGVLVTFRNFGDQPLTSCVLHWKVNGVAQPNVNWNGSIAPWDTMQVLLGTISFTPHNQYAIESWSSQPNGQSDPATLNDSLGEFAFLTAFSGNYTIGGASPDFATFTDAANDLKIYGVCGPVVFYARDGDYDEQFRIDPIRGSSATNTIRFTAESGDSSMVVVHYDSNNSTDNYIVNMNGCKYVTIDHMTFRKDGSTYLNIIRQTFGAQHCDLVSCHLSCTATGTNLTESSLFYAEHGSTNEEYNRIMYCTFQSGYVGIMLDGSSGSDEEYNQILYCVFYDQEEAAIHAEGQFYFDCKYNRLYQNTTYCLYGIWLNVQDVIDVSGNYIQGDFIDAIFLLSCNYTWSSYPVKVYNNMIALTTNAGNHGLHGIMVSNSQGEVLIAHNSIHLYDSLNTVGGQCISFTYGWKVKIYANILCGTSNVTGIACGGVLGSAVEIDDNNYFVGSVLMIVPNAPYTYSTIPSMNTAGFEQNGDTLDPMFTSSTDLHVNQQMLCSSALPIGGITTDYDGDVRSSSPTAGADELNGPAASIQYTATGCAPQTVSFTAGTNTQFTYAWNFGDPSSTSDTANTATAQYNYSMAGTYTVTLIVSASGACGGVDSAVTVLNMNSTVPNVTFTSSADTMCVNDASLFLSGGLPLGGTYSGTSVGGGTFYPNFAGIGTHPITYSYTDSAGCSGSAVHTIVVDACAGVEESDEALMFSVQPNPVSDYLNISWSSPDTESQNEIRIFNMLGECVLIYSINSHAPNGTETLNLQIIPPGVYSVTFSSGQYCQTHKITKL